VGSKTTCTNVSLLPPSETGGMKPADLLEVLNSVLDMVAGDDSFDTPSNASDDDDDSLQRRQ
jgi:hypothetical protein